MELPRLRVYYGPESEPQDTEPVDTAKEPPARPRRVSIPLTELMNWLASAHAEKRIWLQDFAEDEVTISSDLHEVLLAYEQLQRPTA